HTFISTRLPLCHHPPPPTLLSFPTRRSSDLDLSGQQYVGSYPLAIVHLALGEKDEALRLLEQSFMERDILLQGLFGSIKIDKRLDRKSTRLNSSHGSISYAVFCLKKKK